MWAFLLCPKGGEDALQRFMVREYGDDVDRQKDIEWKQFGGMLKKK